VLRRDGSRAAVLSWTAVPGSTGYRWALRRCDGTTVVSSSTKALEKRTSGLGPGCYVGTVQAGAGQPVRRSNELTLP
jgi:hypothetical protein